MLVRCEDVALILPRAVDVGEPVDEAVQHHVNSCLVCQAELASGLANGRSSTTSEPWSSSESARLRLRRWVIEDEVLAVIRYSHVENCASPRNFRMAFQARR